MKPPSRAPTQRQLRVGEEIRHVLSGLFIRGEFRDPTLAAAQLTVTEVRVSPDLKRATAFVARLGRADVASLLPSLGRAAPHLRSQVAHAIRLRVAPELTFQPDEAIEYAGKIAALLHAPEVLRDLSPAEARPGAGSPSPAAGQPDTSTAPSSRRTR